MVGTGTSSLTFPQVVHALSTSPGIALLTGPSAPCYNYSECSNGTEECTEDEGTMTNQVRVEKVRGNMRMRGNSFAAQGARTDPIVRIKKLQKAKWVSRWERAAASGWGCYR